VINDVIIHSSESFWISVGCEDARGGDHLVFDQRCESINLWLGKDAIVLILLICASANRQVELDWMQSECRRFCSGQSTLARQASTEINTVLRNSSRVNKMEAIESRWLNENG
jgi:hypothetical protein